MGLIHLRYGYATYTFGPAGCVAASRKLRNEGERPTGHPEALEAPVGRRAPPARRARDLAVAGADRKSSHFHSHFLDIENRVLYTNPYYNWNPESGRPVDSHED